MIFDKFVQVLVFGAAYAKIPDHTCSATTIRARRDEWITAGVFAGLEQFALEAYDQIVGLDLEQITVDGCLVKAPCSGEAAGRSPVGRGKSGTKRSVLTDGSGIPLGCVTAPANRHDSPLLRPTLEQLARFETRFGLGLPDRMTVHLDAGYDSAKTRDLARLPRGHQQEGVPVAGWGPMGGRADQLVAQPRVREAGHLHLTTRPSHRCVHRAGQLRDHRPQTHPRRVVHASLGHKAHPKTLTYPRDLQVAASAD